MLLKWPCSVLLLVLIMLLGMKVSDVYIFGSKRNSILCLHFRPHINEIDNLILLCC